MEGLAGCRKHNFACFFGMVEGIQDGSFDIFKLSSGLKDSLIVQEYRSVKDFRKFHVFKFQHCFRIELNVDLQGKVRFVYIPNRRLHVSFFAVTIGITLQETSILQSPSIDFNSTFLDLHGLSSSASPVHRTLDTVVLSKMTIRENKMTEGFARDDSMLKIQEKKTTGNLTRGHSINILSLTPGEEDWYWRSKKEAKARGNSS
ncbi:uncharacterized protein C8R40DRAFT_1066381 [Lentinula edodes]|uniref:uncharacterized protein n=1 Tax=Lentinula edodes TaxID=5353 RepID=UPI001E8D615B|nr:uncharacterized protein C8R40DRAFT_1066381 [Lentinula edodes]KAH7879277.1 hypothetical protein C8R40DRAFT_1066381 [Lentinula edodes]